MSKKLIHPIWFLMFLLWGVSGQLFSSEGGDCGILRGLKKPDMIRIQGKQLYVMDHAVVRVYALHNLKLLRQFGAPGSGRGQLPLLSEGANIIRPTREYLLAEGRRKMIFFSKSGTVMDEKSKSEYCTKFTAIGKKWVAKKYFRDYDTNTQYMRVVLFNEDLDELKELHREKWFQQYTGKGFRIELFSDYLNFEVYEGKIFIEKSPRGFVIDVYDAEGKFLYQIKKERPRIQVSDADKIAAMKRLQGDRKMEVMIDMLGSREKVMEVMKVAFPGYKPAIRSVEVDDGKIYVRTFKERDGKDETIIMDLKGNILKTVYLPVFIRPGVEEKMYDARYTAISGDTWYALKPVREKKQWRLHGTRF